MSRVTGIAGMGFPHHITQRDNYRQEVFLDDTDIQQHLFWKEECTSKYHLSIIAYCFMQNHVYLGVPAFIKRLGKIF